MAGVTRAAAHLSVEEVTRRWKHDPRPWCRQRWLIISQALVDPREAAPIAKHGGVSSPTVHHLIWASNRRGVAALETPGLWRTSLSGSDSGAGAAVPGCFFRAGASGEHPPRSPDQASV